MDIPSPSLRTEALHAAPFLAFALLAWGLGIAWAHRGGAPTDDALLPWQASFLARSEGDQRLYRALREGIFEAENLRAAAGGWPSVDALIEAGAPPFAADALLPPLAWTHAREGLYATYLGEGDGQRWLILFIEPDPAALKTPGEPPPPVDEEHHTLSDGTALHVTVWTQPASAPRPAGVPAFPAAEGWTQLVSPRAP